MIWDLRLDMEMYCVSAMYFVCDLGEIMYTLQVYLPLSVIISTFPGFERGKRDARIEHLYVVQYILDTINGSCYYYYYYSFCNYCRANPTVMKS